MTKAITPQSKPHPRPVESAERARDTAADRRRLRIEALEERLAPGRILSGF